MHCVDQVVDRKANQHGYREGCERAPAHALVLPLGLQLQLGLLEPADVAPLRCQRRRPTARRTKNRGALEVLMQLGETFGAELVWAFGVGKRLRALQRAEADCAAVIRGILVPSDHTRVHERGGPDE